jgi:hypothetical protein
MQNGFTVMDNSLAVLHKILNTELPYDPAGPLLGMDAKESKIGTKQIRVHILFKTAKR